MKQLSTGTSLCVAAGLATSRTQRRPSGWNQTKSGPTWAGLFLRSQSSLRIWAERDVLDLRWLFDEMGRS